MTNTAQPALQSIEATIVDAPPVGLYEQTGINKRRRTVQYHYKPSNISFLEDDSERMTVFGEDGKGVTC